MGKFDDFKAPVPDVFPEDIYGVNPKKTTQENYAKQKASQQRLDNRVNYQHVAQKEYIPVVEIDKTMDLVFMDGVLHQKVIETYSTMEVNSGESKVDKIEEKWMKIESITNA